jgi:hypothetical protein
LKEHKPGLMKNVLRILDQRKQAKLQWLHYANQSNVDNLNNVRRAACRHFRERKKKEYLKAKFHILKTSTKIKYIRDLHRGN